MHAASLTRTGQVDDADPPVLADRPEARGGPEARARKGILGMEPLRVAYRRKKKERKRKEKRKDRNGRQLARNYTTLW
jgi:hypothetical protein